MVKQEELVVDQRSTDRRKSIDRRQLTSEEANYTDEDRRITPTRRIVERRRHIDPTTCERDYSQLEIEFMKAMDDYKRKSGRQFPTWSEVLEVMYSLG
jgi:hypothetical protein